MEYTILVLLFYCSIQVIADPVDSTQTLDCDATVQKQHRILLQYSQSHLTTVRSAIRNINDSLQGLTQREQDVKLEAVKSRELAILLQLQLKQMQTQEKELEISISQQEQIGPLENIETYLVAQLERSHESLEFERQCCQFKLEATSKLLESKLELVELKNSQIWKVAENSIQIKNISEQLNICIKEKTNLASENELKNQFNARDGDNSTPLIRAAEKNQASTVKALIDLGANLDLQDNYNQTALTRAASRNNTEICKMLLEAGADVNLRDKWGYTALIHAAGNNNIEMVKMLLAKGAQVNLASNDGYTALHWAAYHGYVEVAKLLVGHGANINVKTNAGATPLKRALSRNKTEVANYLKSVGATE